jgi:tetratricopeptide (TPR) repeat protein
MHCLFNLPLPDQKDKGVMKTQFANMNDFVKSRHSRAGGNPESANQLERLNFHFHGGNKGKGPFPTFYAVINISFRALLSSFLLILLSGQWSNAAEFSAEPQIRPFFKQGIESIFNLDEKNGLAALQRGIELDPDRPIGYAYVAMANLFFLETSFGDKEREKRQEEMLRYAAEAISRGEKRIEKDPKDSQAFFAMSLAKFTRVRLLIMQKRYLAMAQETSNIWDYLQKAHEGDPQNYDIYFPMGLLHFHLDHLPGLTRFFSSILITSGDRQKGLEELELAAMKGDMLKDLAKTELVSVYLNFEEKPEKALPFARELKDRYPRNYNFIFSLGNVLADIKNSSEAFTLAAEIEKGIRTGNPPYPPELQVRYLQLMGRIYFGKGDFSKAWEYFQKVIQDQARYNARSRAAAFVRLGMIADIRKDRKNAEDYYQKAIDVEGAEGFAQVTAKKYLNTPYSPGKTESK